MTICDKGNSAPDELIDLSDNYVSDNEDTRAKVPHLSNLDDINHDFEGYAFEIRQAIKEEIISTTGHSKTITCIIDTTHDASGNYTGQDFYVITPELAQKLRLHLRKVKFHGCHSKDNGYFIFPEKQTPRGRRNSWNASLGQIMEIEPGTYFSIHSDRENRRYLHTVAEQSDAPPNFDHFEDKLLEFFQNHLISSLEDPVIQKLLAK